MNEVEKYHVLAALFASKPTGHQHAPRVQKQ